MDTKQFTYTVTFALRRGTQEDLLAVNEIPRDGEPIIETDTLKIKIGDGETPYSELDYVGAAELAVLQAQLDAFFASAEIGDAAIDTLVEIQKILNDSSIDIQNLLNKVNEFEALHQEINADIEKVENDFKAADDAIVAAHNKDKEEIDTQIDELTKSCNDATADRESIHKAIAVLIDAHDLDNANTNERIDRVEEKYREADNEIIAAYKAADELLSQALTVAKADVLEIHYADKDAITTQLNNFAEECLEANNELRLLINTVNTALQTADTEIINILNSAIADVRSEVESLEAKHDEEIVNLNTDLENIRGEFAAAYNVISANLIAETNRATEAENGLNNQIKEIKNDYLTSVNENAINASISEVSEVANSAKSAIDAFLKDAELSEDAINTLKEIQAELDLNETGAAAMLARIKTLEDVDNATQVELDSAVGTINAEVNKKANLTDVNAIDERVLTLENAGHGTVIQIENAKAEAIAEATSKADAASTNAKTYADGLKENTNQELANIRESIEAVNDRVDNLGGVDLEALTADLATHKEESTQAFIDVRTDFAAADAQITETNTNDHNAINARIDENTVDHQTIRNEMAELNTAATNDRALIREQYTNADSILQSTCEGENAAIRAEFAAGDLQLTTDLGNEIARAEAAEAQALADAKAYTDEVKANLLGEGVLDDTYNTLTKISAWIASEGVDVTELTDAIATEANTRSAEDLRIEEAFKAADKEINDHLIDTDKKHQEDIQSLGNTITNLGTELRGVDNNINARIDSVINDYKAADIAVTADIDARYTKAVEDMVADYIKRDSDIIAYFDEQLGVIMNGAY